MCGFPREITRTPRARRVVARWALAAFAMIAIGGCAQAQSDEPGSVSRVLKLRTVPPPAPDFVVRTRPPETSLNYIPTGAPRPMPAGKPLTPDEIRAKEAELDGLRSRQDRIAGRRSAPRAERSAADGGKPPKKAAAPLRCVLTCPDPATAPVKPGAPQMPAAGL
ncbi:MAG: hypothetical protein JWL62_3105 [Hyphomicrobiales bacterium]|nr:hypothetical protein [Hyphomicrobiales bacterium]